MCSTEYRSISSETRVSMMEFSGVSSAESLLGRSLLFMLPSAGGEFNDTSVIFPWVGAL